MKAWTSLVARVFSHNVTVIGAIVFVVIGAVVYTFVDYWWLPSYTRHSVSLTVPDLRGKTVVDAESTLVAVGLTLVQRGTDFLASAPPNAVLDQLPDSGRAVKPGRRIYVTVNRDAPDLVSVPSTLNLSVRQASARLESSGLRVGRIDADPYPSPYPNLVTSQYPEAGTTVAVGSAINLYYSTGLGDSLVTVPDLSNLSSSAAEEVLKQARLRLVTTDDAPPGTVIQAQTPKPATTVRQGTEIKVTLNGRVTVDR